RVRRQISQGRGLADHQRGEAPDALRLPRRALAAPAYDEPDRVDLRHREAASACHERRWLPGGGRAMAFKLLLAAERRWRKLNGASLLPLVREGALFRDGTRVERKDKTKISKDEHVHQEQKVAA